MMDMNIHILKHWKMELKIDAAHNWGGTKRLCKLLTKTEILHFKDSDFLTIYVSTLTRSVTDEIRFNDENSILEIVISTDGTDVPNAIVGGVYFASGLIDEGVLIRNIKTYTSPKFYGLVFQEIKKNNRPDS